MRIKSICLSTGLCYSLTQPSNVSKFQEVKQDQECLSPGRFASSGSCGRWQKHGAGREGPADESDGEQVTYRQIVLR